MVTYLQVQSGMYFSEFMVLFLNKMSKLNQEEISILSDYEAGDDNMVVPLTLGISQEPRY